MNMRTKIINGFSMVEMLAVTVILTVVITITIPVVTDLVKNAKEDAFLDNAKMIAKAIDYKLLEDNTFDVTTITKDNMAEILNLSADNYSSLTVTKDENDKVKLVIEGTDKWDGLVAYGAVEKISVVDSEEYSEGRPVITILGDNPVSISVGSVYNDVGATASDMQDGDITDDIVVNNSVNVNVIGSYTVTYNVVDSDGNAAVQVARTVNIIDTTPPVITMLGDSPIGIAKGSVYSDAGATALDDVDGNITDNIVVTSTVNVNLTGTYTVTYTVSDAAGNEATPVVRTVNVIGAYLASEGVNKPQLASGMTAVKWNGTSWIEVADPDTDTSWYDYTNKEWANAKTADGSMWVWIPRYAYRITSGWHTNTTGIVDISFSIETDDTRDGAITLDEGTTSEASNNKWTNHPAFTFGNDELLGIWVAKFEPSNDGSNNVKVIPNTPSWRSITIGDAFDKCRSMETNTVYGWGTTGTGIDTHLIKNTEWGAVGYISKSAYGKNTEEIWINPANDYTTGCAGDSVTTSYTTGCINSYETTNGVKASTTGNIYGIYDLSGGAYEYTSSYIDNGYSSLTSYASSILNADAKYKDAYTPAATDSDTNNYGLAINKKGDAIYETSSSGVYTSSTSWFNDYSSMPSSSNPTFIRSGYYNNSTTAGIFNFGASSGNPSSPKSFRPILLVGEDL